MKILYINPQNPEIEFVKQAADVILNNGVIGYPTETIYGLGANAVSDFAVDRVFEIKGREKNKPILIIAYNIEQVRNLIEYFSSAAEKLVKYFWPGPLTIVFKASDKINKKLCSTDNTIGIRIPDNKICLELLGIAGVPLTSTSANIAGGKNPLSANDVINELGEQLDLVIDGGVAKLSIPSTVLDLSAGQPILIREGVISKKYIEQIIGFKLDEDE